MKKIILLLHAVACFSLFASEEPWLVHSNEPHQLTVLDHGADSLVERLNLIESARDTIDLEYFIYNNDRAGRILTQALVKKAREGVRVRMLLDYFQTKSQITLEMAQVLKENGVEVKYYNTAPTIRFRKMNHRNHRKMIQVDGKKALIGGRNVADEYFDIREDYNFVDRDVVVEGPVVPKMVDSFDRYWEHELSETPAKPRVPLLRRRKRKARARMAEAREFIVQNDEDREVLRQLYAGHEKSRGNRISGICNKLTFGTSKPGWKKSAEPGKHLGDYLNRQLLTAPKSCKNRLLIDSAYFILDKNMRKIFKTLQEEGTDVDVITNGTYAHDVFVMTPAGNVTMKRLLKRDVDFWTYNGSEPKNYHVDENYSNARWGTHTKSVIIGNDSFLIGSYNLDPRAHHLNGEMAIFCHETPEMTKELVSAFEARKKDSTPIRNRKEYRRAILKKISPGQRAIYFLAWPLANMLKPMF